MCVFFFLGGAGGGGKSELFREDEERRVNIKTFCLHISHLGEERHELNR